MVDTVTSQIIENGPRWFVVRFTNVSDGTGESGVVKVDGSPSGPLGVNIGGQVFFPGIHIRVVDIEYDIKAMGLRIQWDATAALDMVYLSGFNRLKFHKWGGVNIPVGTSGATGKILFTTVGQMANSGYTVLMRGTKGISQ